MAEREYTKSWPKVMGPFMYKCEEKFPFHTVFEHLVVVCIAPDNQYVTPNTGKLHVTEFPLAKSDDEDSNPLAKFISLMVSRCLG